MAEITYYEIITGYNKIEKYATFEQAVNDIKENSFNNYETIHKVTIAVTDTVTETNIKVAKIITKYGIARIEWLKTKILDKQNEIDVINSRAYKNEKTRAAKIDLINKVYNSYEKELNDLIEIAE